MIATRPRTRLATGLVLAGVALAGCSTQSPITTNMSYDASDGVGATVGAARATNLLVVTAEEGAPGVLVGAVTNDGVEEAAVTFAVEGSRDVDVRVGGGQTVFFGGEEDAIELATVPVRPGGTLPVQMSSPAGGSTTIPVPVLDGTLPEYASLVRTPLTGTDPDPTPSASGTAEAEEDVDH